MLHGSCHCGAVQWDWTHPVLPAGATVCNCTVCRRDGVLWNCGRPQGLGHDQRLHSRQGGLVSFDISNSHRKESAAWPSTFA